MCDRCEDLEEQVAYYKSELGLSVTQDEVSALRKAFGVSPAEAMILVALYRAKGRVLSAYQLLDTLPARYADQDDRDVHLPSVHISRIRRRIGPDFLKNEWGRGYQLTPQGMELVGHALGEAERPVSAVELRDIADRTSEEIRGLVAHAAGILAHRDGDGGLETAKTFHRIADRLTGQPRAAA